MTNTNIYIQNQILRTTDDEEEEKEMICAR